MGPAITVCVFLLVLWFIVTETSPVDVINAIGNCLHKDKD